MDFFTLLIFFSFTVFIMLGLYLIRTGYKSLLIQIFFLLSLSFAIWAFSYSFVIHYNAASKDQLLFWYNFSSVGWITFPALFISFSLVLAKHVRLLKKPWMLALIIVPPIIFIYKEFTGYLLIESFKSSQFGTIEIHKKDIWYFLYTAYYFIYVITGFVLIYIWGKNSKVKANKLQSSVIVKYGIFTLLASASTNTVLPSMGIEFPAIAPAWILIWFIALIYAIRNYDFLSISSKLVSEEIFDRVNDLIFFLNPEGEIIKLNEKAKTTLTLPKNYEKLHLASLFKENEKVNDVIKNIIRKEPYTFSVELELSKEYTDKIIPVSVYFAVIFNKTGDNSGILVMAQDITQTKKLQVEIDERKLSENFLEEAKQLYKDIIDDLPEGIFESDKEGRLIFVNKQTLRYFQYTRKDMDVGLYLADLIAPSERALFFSELQKSVEVGEQDVIECNAITKSGKKFPILYYSKPVYLAGKHVGYRGFFIDYTERKQQENLLQEMVELSNMISSFSSKLINTRTEELYFHLLKGLSHFKRQLHFELVDVYRINTLSNNFVKIISDRESEIIFPKADQNEIKASEAPEFVKLLWQKKQLYISDIEENNEKNNNDAAVEFMHAYGLHSMLMLPMIFDNQLYGFICFGSDRKTKISSQAIDMLKILGESVAGTIQRKEVVDALKESETNYRELAETLPEAILEIDPQGNILYANNQTLKYWGYTPEECEKDGLNIIEMLAREDRNRAIDDLKKKLSGVEFGYVEYKGIKKDHSFFPFLMYMNPIFKDEKAKGFRGIAIDITEQKRNADQLQKAKISAEASNQAKSIFLANMSHEIRTPLNAIIGFSKLLENEDLPKKTRGYIKTILSSSKTLLSLINDVLDLSKIEAGRMELKYRPLRLEDVCEEMRKIFSFKTDEKNLDFLIEIDNNLPHEVYLDETRIRQILLNLISNGIKFTDAGYIKMEIQHKANQKFNDLIDLIISVEDTGIGIPEGQQGTVFEAFQQIKGQNIKKYGGTGLGLSITRKLVELMGGYISVQSNFEKGSRFNIFIPNVLVVKEKNREKITADLIDMAYPIQGSSLLLVGLKEKNHSFFKEFIDYHELHSDQCVMLLKDIEKKLKSNFQFAIFDFSDYNIIDQEKIKIFSQLKALKSIPTVLLLSNHVDFAFDDLRKAYIDAIIKTPIDSSELRQLIYKYKTVITDKIIDHQVNEHERQTKEITEYLKTLDEGKRKRITNTLQYDLMDNYNEISKTLRINHIKSFAESLKKFGKKEKISNIEKLGADLLKEAEKFNIAKIKKILTYFPKIVDDMIKYKNFEK